MAVDLERAWHPWSGRYRLAHCFEEGFAELNALFPLRKQGAQEGTVGDLSHQAEGSGSDHNPNGEGVIRAWDIERDDSQFNAQKLANKLQQLMASHHPMFGSRGYVIYNRRITAWQPWASWQPYNGSDPHDRHIHLSVGANASEYDNKASWGLISAFKSTSSTAAPVGKKDGFDMASLADLARINQAGVDNINKNLLVYGGAKYVRFPKAPKGANAIYMLTGSSLLWMSPTDWKAFGSSHFVDIPNHAGSNIYKLPIAPGTLDPRK